MGKGKRENVCGVKAVLHNGLGYIHKLSVISYSQGGNILTYQTERHLDLMLSMVHL